MPGRRAKRRGVADAADAASDAFRGWVDADRRLPDNPCMSPLRDLPLVPLLIAVNAFFVAAEYAMVALRQSQIELLRRDGWLRVAAALHSLKRDISGAIAAVQLCITLTNLLLGWIGEPAMSALLRLLVEPLVRALPPALFTALSTALSFVIVTMLTVVLSELLPKALTLRHVRQVAIVTAIPVRWIMTAIRPLVAVMNALANAVTRSLGLGRVTEMETQALTAEEIRVVASEAAAAGALTPRERSLILNSLSLGRRSAEEIMVPRVRIEYLDLARTMQENWETVGQHLHSRLPLCNNGIDHVVGVVRAREFLEAYYAGGDSSVLQLICRPPVFAPSSISLDQLLVMFDEHQTQMILLADEHGGIEGLVTLRDVVDELVGTPLARGSAAPPRLLQIEGTTPLGDLARQFGLGDWPTEEPVVTVSGLLADRLGRIPAVGDQVQTGGFLFRVLASDGRAARRVEVRLLDQPAQT